MVIRATKSVEAVSAQEIQTKKSDGAVSAQENADNKRPLTSGKVLDIFNRKVFMLNGKVFYYDTKTQKITGSTLPTEEDLKLLDFMINGISLPSDSSPKEKPTKVIEETDILNEEIVAAPAKPVKTSTTSAEQVKSVPVSTSKPAAKEVKSEVTAANPNNTVKTSPEKANPFMDASKPLPKTVAPAKIVAPATTVANSYIDIINQEIASAKKLIDILVKFFGKNEEVKAEDKPADVKPEVKPAAAKAEGIGNQNLTLVQKLFDIFCKLAELIIGLKPEVELAETKPEVKEVKQTEVKPEANAVKPEVKSAEVMPEVKEVKPEVKSAEVKPEVKEVKPEVKSAEVKPEVKEVKPEVKHEVKHAEVEPKITEVKPEDTANPKVVINNPNVVIINSKNNNINHVKDTTPAFETEIIENAVVKNKSKEEIIKELKGENYLTYDEISRMIA